jgi:hypothetical protein
MQHPDYKFIEHLNQLLQGAKTKIFKNIINLHFKTAELDQKVLKK